MTRRTKRRDRFTMSSGHCVRCGSFGFTEPPRSATLKRIPSGGYWCRDGRECTLRIKRRKRRKRRAP